MVPSPDPGGAAREERPDDGRSTRPRPELRWVRLRAPRRAVEIGRNGRVLARRYREEVDAWEVLLETDGREA